MRDCTFRSLGLMRRKVLTAWRRHHAAMADTPAHRARLPRQIPSFALYGEAAQPGPELLHVEEILSRSRLYRWEITPHRHQGLYQVLWVWSGQARIWLDDQRIDADGPVAVVLPPGVVHGFRFTPMTDGLVLTLSQRLLVDDELQSGTEAFGQLFATPRVLRLARQDEQATRLDALLRNLADEFASPLGAQSPVPLWLARSVVWRLSRLRADELHAGTASGARHAALFTRFVLLVEQHFAEHWPLSQYASRLGLSTARLNRLARAHRGQPALEVIHERLTREACRRLQYVAAPAASLGMELGFDDPAYFSRFFRRRTGMTPGRWRQAHQAQQDPGVRQGQAEGPAAA